MVDLCVIFFGGYTLEVILQAPCLLYKLAVVPIRPVPLFTETLWIHHLGFQVTLVSKSGVCCRGSYISI